MAAKTQRGKGAQPVEARAKRTRELILQAAIDSILGGGIQGFTANELMRRTGLSKGALFHHFDSLDDVAIECVNKGDRVLVIEERGTLRETLEYTMTSTHGHRRMRALACLLYFYCEKARFDTRFRKPMNHLNNARQQLMSEMMQKFAPKAKPEQVSHAARFLTCAQMGLAGPSGDCLQSADRLRAWSESVEHALVMLR